MPAVAGIPLDTIYQALGVSGPAPDSQDSAPALDNPLSSPDQLNATPGAPDQSQPQRVSVSGGQSASVGTQSKSFSGQAYDQVVGKTKGVDAQLAAISGAQNANLSGLASDANTVAQEQKQAIAEDTAAQQAKITAEGQENSKLADMNQKMAVEESRQSAIAAQKVTQQAANYEAALNEFRAARVDPNQLWHSMRGYDKVGMLATAFVHDFLGAKGIHTSAIDTFNRAVDQNIAAQVENIRNKREAAEGFKTLWQMAQDQSRTEAEARLRVRGYMMDSFKAQVASELAGYDSKLAATKGAAAQAAVDGELLKVKGDLAKIWQENANADKSAIVSLAGHRITAAATEQAARISAGAHLGAAAAEAQQKKIENAQKTAVRNPENSPGQVVFGPDGLPHQLPGTTQVLGFANTPEDAVKIKEKLNDTYNNIGEANQYIAELKQLGSHYGGPGASRFQGTDAARVDALRQHLAVTLDKAMAGVRGASSPQLIDMYNKFYTQADWTTVDGVNKAIATASTITQAARASAATETATLRYGDPEERAAAGQGVGNEVAPIGPNASAPGKFAPGQATELNANAHFLNHDTSTPIDQLANQVQAADNSKPGARTRVDPSGYEAQEYTQFTHDKRDPEDLDKYDRINQRVVAGIDSSSDYTVPNWAEAMMQLQQIATPNAQAANPLFRGMPDQYTPQERQDAIDKLTEFARGGALSDEKGTEAITGDQVLFAQYLLSQVARPQSHP